MGLLYAVITIGLGVGAVGMMGAATFGAGLLWLVGGYMLALFTGLCLLEWPDSTPDSALGRATWKAVCILMIGALVSISLYQAVGSIWGSKVPFVGAVAAFTMLLGAGWRER